MALSDEITNGTPRITVIHFPNGEYSDISTGFHDGKTYCNNSLADGDGDINIIGCIASEFGCELEGIDDITNLIIQVYQTIGSYTVNKFYGRVKSAVLSADKSYRKIVAYSEFYYQGDTDMTTWYAGLTFDNTLTLSKFLLSALSYVGITASTGLSVSQTSFIVTKNTSGPLKFSTLIKAICQLCGGFGYIGPDGKFNIIYFNTPSTIKNIPVRSGFKYESYDVAAINKVVIRSEETDVGGTYGSGTNSYIIQGNFLCYGKGAAELLAAAHILYDKVSGYSWTPVECQLPVCDPEVNLLGSVVDISSESGTTVRTIFLKEEQSGSMLISQKFYSMGDQTRNETVETIDTSLSILNAKYFKLSASVDGLDLEVGSKVGTDELISKINVSPESVKISTNKLSITGIIEAINSDGTTTIDGGKLTNNSVTTKQLSIGLGTKNLALTSGGYQTTSVTKWIIDTAANWSKTLYSGYIRFTKLTAASGSWIRLPFSGALTIGNTYTFTVKIRTSLAKTGAGLNIADASNGTQLISGITTVSNTWTTISATAVATKAGIQLIFTSTNFTTANETLDIAYISVTEGDVVTYWSPAPEDLDVRSIYTSGTTTINGGNITTGSITASKIDVDDLFAQSITATNLTIAGGGIDISSASQTAQSYVTMTNSWTAGSIPYVFTSASSATDFSLTVSSTAGSAYYQNIGVSAGGIYGWGKTSGGADVLGMALKPNSVSSFYVGLDVYEGLYVKSGDFKTDSISVYTTNAQFNLPYGVYINTSGSVVLPNTGSFFVKDSGGTARTVATLDSSNNYYFASGGVNNITYIGTTTNTTDMYLRTTSGRNVYINGAQYLRSTSDNYAYLGSGSYRWNTVYAGTGTINTSDANEKKNIECITDNYAALFDKVQAKIYQFIDGTSGRTHVGFVAQDVKAAMDDIGLTAMDFAGYCSDTWTDEETGIEKTRLGLRYEEFIPILWDQVQRMKAALAAHNITY